MSDREFDLVVLGARGDTSHLDGGRASPDMSPRRERTGNERRVREPCKGSHKYPKSGHHASLRLGRRSRWGGTYG